MKKVILKSLLTSVIAAGAILMLASCIVFIENEQIAQTICPFYSLN